MLKIESESLARSSAHGQIVSVLSDYLALTKPPIIALLLLTALGGMFLAAQGVPPLPVAALLLLGGAGAAAGASSINHYLDKDVDSLMLRTQRRPIPGRRVSPSSALIFGISLNVFAFALLASTVNLLSAFITLGGTLFYVLVYTLWLKRTTPQNIVIGGAAGAVPPVAGWAAVTGGVELPALYLFAIIFFWTPPHFWALSLLMKDDYARAGIPMLPVVYGETETRRNIFLYTIILVALTLLPFTIQQVGWIYFVSAVTLGSIFLYYAWRLVSISEDASRRDASRRERRVYLASLLYLALLFAAIMVDTTVHLG